MVNPNTDEKITLRPSVLSGDKEDYKDAIGLVTEKTSPDSLADSINNSIEAVGAMIYIKTGGKITALTNNFYLTGLSFSYKERVQLLENFNSANVAFFGESAKVYQLQGVAVDYASTDEEDVGKYFHQSSLIQMYQTVLRGTKLVENNSVAVLKVLNHTIEGYPLNFQVSYNSSADKLAQFTMSWVVVGHDLVSENTVNSDRLKSFYDVSAKKSIKAIDDFVAKIDLYLKVPDLKIDPKFAENFMTTDTQTIIDTPAVTSIKGFVDYVKILENLFNDVVAAAEGDDDVIKQYRDKLTAQKNNPNSPTIVAFINANLTMLNNIKKDLITQKIKRLYGTV